MRIGFALRISCVFCVALAQSAFCATPSPDDVRFSGTWTGKVLNLGWIAIDYRGLAQGQVGPRELWWFVEGVAITGKAEGTKLRISYTDHQGHVQEGLVFTLIEGRRLRLEPGGLLPDPLPAPFAGLELTRVGDDQWYNLTNNYYKTSQWGIWHQAGELKALPSDWPTPLADATARFFSGRNHELAPVLAVPTVSKEMLAEAFRWTMDKPRWNDQRDWIQRVIASNPSCGRSTLIELWQLPESPQIWYAAAQNPNASKEWLMEFPQRILNGSSRNQQLAIRDRDLSSDLVELFAEKGCAEVLSGVVGHPHTTVRALESVCRRIKKERGGDPYIWEEIASQPKAPVAFLLELSQTAIESKHAQLLAALASNQALPIDSHKTVAEARFQAVFGDGSPPFNYGPGPLSDPYLAPAHISELIDLPVPSVRAALASNPSLSDDQLKKLAADSTEYVSRTALDNWKKRYPSAPLPVIPVTAGKKNFSDTSELREMILSGKTDEAVAIWLKLPKGLQSQLGQVTYWEKERVPLPPILCFIEAAEARGGPLAMNLLSALIQNAPEHIEEMKNRGLLEKIAAFPPLSQAISAGRAGTVQLLLDAGLNANCRGDGGVTPLMLAAALGDSEIVSVLLKHGANRQAKDGSSFTAVDYAYQRLKPATMAMLVETPEDSAKLKELQGQLTPTAANSSIVGRWSNNKDGFGTVVVVFDENGSFNFGAGLLALRGKWQALGPDRVVATPIWPEPQPSLPTAKDDLDEFKKVFRELVFTSLNNPIRLNLTFPNGTVEVLFREVR